MWEFLGEVLKQHGLAAVIAVGVIIAFALAIRALWKRNEELSKRLEAQVTAHVQTIAAKDTAFAQALADKDKVHILALAEKESGHAAEMKQVVTRMSARIDELQEKRVNQGHEFVRQVTEHVAATRQAVEKTTVAIETLTHAVGRGGRGD